MTDIDTLIRDLEAATEGSEKLDKDIARSLGFRIAATTGGPHIMHQNDDVASWDLPRYSRSLDAALTLVPEGWSVAGLWEAVKPNDRPWWGVNMRRDKPYKVLTAQGSPTPALALTITALKAWSAA